MDSTVYVTRDPERALGLPLDTPGYFIITNKSGFANDAIKNRENVLLVAATEPLDTHELLRREETVAFLSRLRIPGILVFKNTPQIERICQERGFQLLNPPAALSARVEDKISQVEWLGDLAQLLPPHRIAIAKNIRYDGGSFILQFNRAHTGLGTMLITNSEELANIQSKFPNRPARVTAYIAGPVFTNNNVAASHGIMCGNISYQITGLAPFTDNPFATIGNDWGVAKRHLTHDQVTQYREIATLIGDKLRADGWRGLFGIDVIMDEQSGKVYLLEINARQPASATFESQLQSQVRSHAPCVTTFEAHLAALLGQDISGASLTPIDDGAQIIYRMTNDTLRMMHNDERTRKLGKLGFRVIPYDNTKPGAELLRIQSKTSLMEAPGVLNERGRMIRNIVQ